MINQPTNQSINKSINVPVYLPTHDRSSLPRLGVVLLASLGTLHSKPRRRHGSDLFRAVFRCSQVIPTHTHTYIYIEIETDSKVKTDKIIDAQYLSGHLKHCSCDDVACCCLCGPRKEGDGLLIENLGLWRRSCEQQVATHLCGYLLEARTFHPGRNS